MTCFMFLMGWEVFEPNCSCQPGGPLLAACRGSLSLGVIHEVLQFFAGLEEGNFLGGHFYLVAGFRIAVDSSAALPRRAAVESAVAQHIALLQRSNKAIQKSFVQRVRL